jgi:hypothetical protein
VSVRKQPFFIIRHFYSLNLRCARDRFPPTLVPACWKRVNCGNDNRTDTIYSRPSSITGNSISLVEQTFHELFKPYNQFLTNMDGSLLKVKLFTRKDAWQYVLRLLPSASLLQTLQHNKGKIITRAGLADETIDFFKQLRTYIFSRSSFYFLQKNLEPLVTKEFLFLVQRLC